MKLESDFQKRVLAVLLTAGDYGARMRDFERALYWTDRDMAQTKAILGKLAEAGIVRVEKKQTGTAGIMDEFYVLNPCEITPLSAAAKA